MIAQISETGNSWSVIMDTTQVQTLWKIMEELREANQLEQALSSCLDILCAATGSPKGTIWMLDDQSNRTVAITVSGTADATGESAGPGEGLVGKVVESGQTQMLKAQDVKNIRLAGVDGPALNGLNILCVPVKAVKSTLGCMLLTGKNEPYTEDEQKLLLGLVHEVDDYLNTQVARYDNKDNIRQTAKDVAKDVRRRKNDD